MNAASAHMGIVGYVTSYGPPRQRERIEAALAEAGVTAVEIVEETPRLEGEGHRGLARVYEHAARSDVDTLLVTSFDVLFSDRREANRWRRDVAAKYGVRVLEVG